MIDYVVMEIEGNFPPIGKRLGVLQRSGVKNSGFTEDTYYMYGTGADFRLKVNPTRDRLILKFCPPKILQGHNGLGSNDLLGVVRHAVPLILKSVNVPVDRALNQRLTDGDYRLRELHIAELHRMPHASISRLVDAIRRYAPSELSAVPLDKGIGIRLWPNSQVRQVLIYDKVEYFKNKYRQTEDVLHAGVEPAGFQWFGLSMDFDQLQQHLRQGVRIEVRLKADYFGRRHAPKPMTEAQQESDRQLGSAWTVNLVRQMYRETLNSVPLEDRILSFELDAAVAESAWPVNALLQLWSGGEDPRSMGLPQTSYGRYRRAILNCYGRDISRSVVHLAHGVTWKGLIDPASIVPGAPEWSRSSGFFFNPSRPRQVARLGAATLSKKDGREASTQ